MGVCTGFLTLMFPLAVLGVLTPSPFLPGTGPDVPPIIIPVDNQRCVAMRRETRRIQVPIPFFCHPKDADGIPFPQVIDKDITLMIMRLQWSGYSVCTRQIPMPTHRYIPVPVCCPGWQRGPTGKCDMPTFTPPPAIHGPCLNGGILKNNGKCCQCLPGFSGSLCQHTTPPLKTGFRSPLPAPRKIDRPPMDQAARGRPVDAAPRKSPVDVRMRPQINIAPAQLRSRITQLLRSRQRPDGSGRPLTISPSLIKLITEKKNQIQRQNPRIRNPYRILNKKPVRVPINTAYINQLPRQPTRPVKPVVKTTRINKVPQRPRLGIRPPVNTAYINQLPRRPNRPIKVPTNVAYINPLTQRFLRPSVNTGNNNPYLNPRPLRITVNTANINRVPRVDPRRNRPVVNTASINQLPPRNRRPVQPPRQTSHINRVPKIPSVNKRPTTVPRTPPNLPPRPVMAPPVALTPRIGIVPGINPAAINPFVAPRVKSQPTDQRGIAVNPPPVKIPQRPPPQEVPKPPTRPAQNTPSFEASEDQCKQILEVGVTRCFRDAGITAAPRDVFNPQNPEVARSICSQGGRLRPCIMAGETACGRGMRVIITRRMLASLLSAMGNLCTSRPMTRPMRKTCLNGGLAVRKDGKHVCECPEGFGGELCELPICTPACENNGLCENVDGSARCVCPNGFYGDQCQNVVAVTTVMDPKPVDPPTHSLETSPNPVDPPTHSLETSPNPVPVPVPSRNAGPRQRETIHKTNAEKVSHDTHVAKMEILGYPLWFVLAILLGFFVFLLVIFVSCCLCMKCRRSKRTFEVTKEAIKLPLPVLDNVYTVGVVPPVYEAKGIPPLSYEEAKGETIKGLAKQLENNEEDEDDGNREEK